MVFGGHFISCTGYAFVFFTLSQLYGLEVVVPSFLSLTGVLAVLDLQLSILSTHIPVEFPPARSSDQSCALEFEPGRPTSLFLNIE